jgi:hypothetical protein
MPRNVRNFWITLDVDGKKERVATGPRSSGGGFELQILMRERGEISIAGRLSITGRVREGQLFLNAVHPFTGKELRFVTLRDSPIKKKKPHGQTRALKNFLHAVKGISNES